MTPLGVLIGIAAGCTAVAFMLIAAWCAADVTIDGDDPFELSDEAQRDDELMRLRRDLPCRCDRCDPASDDAARARLALVVGNAAENVDRRDRRRGR